MADLEITVYTTPSTTQIVEAGVVGTGGSGDPHDVTASEVSIVDTAGLYDATNVESALEEVGGLFADVADLNTFFADLDIPALATDAELEDAIEAIPELGSSDETLITIHTDTVGSDLVTFVDPSGIADALGSVGSGSVVSFQDVPRRSGSAGAASITDRLAIDVIIGDSGARGVGATTLGLNDWATIACTTENRNAGLADPGPGFVFVNEDEDVYGNLKWSTHTNGTAGTTGPSCVSGGPPDECWVLSTSGHLVADTRVFRRADVYYELQASSAATIQVSVDGGSTWSSSQSTTGSGYGVIAGTDLGGSASRTLQVRTSSAGSAKIIGARYYQTDGTAGAVVDNLAHGGTETQDWLDNRGWETWLAKVLLDDTSVANGGTALHGEAEIGARRLFINLTGNDMLQGVSAATALANLTTIVDRAQAASPLTEIVLMAYYYPAHPSAPISLTGVGASAWESDWVAGIRAVALANNCTFVNEYDRFGDCSEGADPYGFTMDEGLHFGSASNSASGVDGQRARAELYLERLSYSRHSPDVLNRHLSGGDEKVYGLAHNLDFEDSGGEIVIADVDVFSDGSVFLPVLGVKHSGDTYARIALFNGQVYSGDGTTAPVTGAAGTRHEVANANYAVVAGVRYAAYTTLATSTKTVTLRPAADYAPNTAVIVADESGSATATLGIDVEANGTEQIVGEVLGVIPLRGPYTAGVFTTDGVDSWSYRATPLQPNTTGTLTTSNVKVPTDSTVKTYIDNADVLAVAYTDAMSLSGVYGDGSDGAVTWDGTTTLLGIVPASSSYTLTRDIFLTNSTINTGVTINPGAFRIFVQGTLTGAGTAKIAAGSLVRDGGSFTATTGGIAQSTQVLGGSQAGVNGTNGAGGSTSNLTNSLGGRGGAGGAGATAAGSAGTVTAPVAANGSVRQLPNALLAALQSITLPTLTPVTGGTGGGAGGGNGTTNFAGPSGAGGAILVVAAFKIAGTITFDAKGGNGGPATGAGNSGGGGGGGGGLIIVLSKTPSIPTCTVAGGTGGAKLGTGAIGSDGSVGTIIRITG